MYIASPADGVAWITGASSGIGRQVAIDLAAQGFTVIATARRAGELDALAAIAPAPGRILAAPCDATDTAAMAALVAGIIETHGAIALAFLNVGMNDVDWRDPFEATKGWATFEGNVKSVVNGLGPLVAHMEVRGRGQIAINGSLAGYVGVTGAGYYGASKAALLHLSETLRMQLAPAGITVQLVSPGFIATPLTAGAPFPMPFLMSVEAASARIVAGFATSRFEITFPRRLSYVLKLLRVLPHWAYFPLGRMLAIMRPADKQR
jgi:NAD(P)-dependent dehydrogenase (short-subunit alcohol dehydrogenase family)